MSPSWIPTPFNRRSSQCKAFSNSWTVDSACPSRNNGTFPNTTTRGAAAGGRCKVWDPAFVVPYSDLPYFLLIPGPLFPGGILSCPAVAQLRLKLPFGKLVTSVAVLGALSPDRLVNLGEFAGYIGYLRDILIHSSDRASDCRDNRECLSLRYSFLHRWFT